MIKKYYIALFGNRSSHGLIPGLFGEIYELFRYRGFRGTVFSEGFTVKTSHILFEDLSRRLNIFTRVVRG